jgi:monofunctional glycosyltransferase
LLLLPVMLLATYYGLAAFLLLLYNVVPPPVTGVQIQRLVESVFEEEDYAYRYNPEPLDEISSHLQHAVVAAEDGRFYEHFGVDWQAIQDAIEDNRQRGTMWRGGSTITQQLVKNLFMTTHSSIIRKALEFPLTYMAEVLLPKDRILYLYLNVIEWGRGVYGAEAAAQRYYGTAAANLSRYQAATLAAIIPNPRTRSPQRMGSYTSTILTRMGQMGW